MAALWSVAKLSRHTAFKKDHWCIIKTWAFRYGRRCSCVGLRACCSLGLRWLWCVGHDIKLPCSGEGACSSENGLWRIQVSYKLVFFLEYLGPLLIYPFFWSNPGRELIHGVSREALPTTMTQNLALVYWSFHYLKVWSSSAQAPSQCQHSTCLLNARLAHVTAPPARPVHVQRIYETAHVHKFSHATMPIFNLFRNCSYYWLFAAFVSYNINHPRYTEPPSLQVLIAFAIAYCCQVCPNLACPTSVPVPVPWSFAIVVRGCNQTVMRSGCSVSVSLE